MILRIVLPLCIVLYVQKYATVYSINVFDQSGGATVSENSGLITLKWATDESNSTYSLYVAEPDKTGYRSIFQRKKVSSYRFQRPGHCYEADFFVKTDDRKETPIKRVHVGAGELPAAVKIGNFSIVYQWYDEITGEITINFEWKNNATLLRNWTNEEVEQNSVIHVMECGDGVDAETPQMQFTSTTQGEIVLDKAYAAALARSVQLHPKCILLITVTSPIRVCGRSVPIEERTDPSMPGLNSVVVVLNCGSMENLECRSNNVAVGGAAEPSSEHLPEVKHPAIPRCDPDNVTSHWISKTKLKIDWNFKFAVKPALRAYMLRYGKVYNTKPSSSGNANFALDMMFPTLDELGRRQMNGNETTLTVDFEKRDEKYANFEYKISICALFDGNSDNDINWAIVPMYNL